MGLLIIIVRLLLLLCWGCSVAAWISFFGFVDDLAVVSFAGVCVLRLFCLIVLLFGVLIWFMIAF